MADQPKPQPGTKARLIREGIEQHPTLTPEQLAEVLNNQHQHLGIDFSAADVRHARHVLREPAGTNDTGTIPGYRPLFTDRIPPVREGTPIQETPPARPKPGGEGRAEA